MNPKSFQVLLQKCVSFGNLKQVHANALTRGFLYTHQPFSCSLLNAYTKLNHPKEALKVFDQITDPDLVSYTCLIYLYLHIHNPLQAFSVFVDLIKSKLRPDSFIVVGALSACGGIKDLSSGKAVHGMICRLQLDTEPIVGNALIDMYCRGGELRIAQMVFEQMGVKDVASWTSMLNGFVLCKELDSARRMFDEMPNRNAVAWTAMITGYVRGDMPIHGLQLFKQMRAEGEDYPTNVTIVAVLSACTEVGALDFGQSNHGYICKVCLSEDVTLNNALIDMYSKCGFPKMAMKVFSNMAKKNVFSWTSMISAYAFHGKGKKALGIFDDMLDSKIIPNDVTFLSILSACSHAGLVAEAHTVFNRMIESYGFEPKIEHYGCMVDVLGRAGHLEEAKEFIKKMPIEPDAIIWRSLLGACLLHKNLNMAEMVGERIIQLQPNDDGVYVLLWNMYCAANRKEDALKMRMMMRDHKVKKKPACSWIEINGVVHKFLAEEASHHASAEIYLLLDIISDHLKLDFDTSMLDLNTLR